MNVNDGISNILEQKGHQVWAISPNAMVVDAIQQMADKNVGALVVMEGEKLVGIISERDYTRKVFLKGKASVDTPVKSIMSTPVITVTPRHTVEECMRIMTEHRVRHLPVVDHEKVIGVISIGNLVNWIITAQKVTIDHLHNYITGQYPG